MGLLPDVSLTLRSLGPDGWLLFVARSARMFAYGSLAVVLVLYLKAAGLASDRIGALLTFTLLGDTVISLWLTTSADRWGRRRTLIAGALLMGLAGLAFAITNEFFPLLLAATIGVISPSGNEVGPFLSVEQAALSETLHDDDRTAVFAWYNLAGSVATALGALGGGWLCHWTAAAGASGAAVYQPVIVLYSIIGLVLIAAFSRLSPATEPIVQPDARRPALFFGLYRSRSIVLMLAVLFALDAFGGGLILQSLVADWFHIRFDVDTAVLGTIFFAANLFAAASSLAAAELARRFGLLNTMVFTHLPSNVLLMIVPLMPNLSLAIGVLLVRFSISQMDVPTRQSYTMMVVHSDERSAAAGITAVARSIGAALSPYLATLLLANPATLSMPFYLAGAIKIAYDLWLYWAFTTVRPANDDEQHG
jgi:MFS family permease